MDKKSIATFGEKEVRRNWDKENEKWWFSVVDIVGVLTEQATHDGARKYWSVMKTRLKQEGAEPTTICSQLKMVAYDGKLRDTDVADTEQILRIIQSIPSKKAEPFKQWLAKVGNERIDEMFDPELVINRVVEHYRRLGFSDSKIMQRIKTIEVRNTLTNEWKDAGVQNNEYGILTDLMYKTWSGKSAKEYKEHKGLKKESLRDNMTNTELALNMLAETVATDLTKERKPKNINGAKVAAKDGASVAKNARQNIENLTGKSVISPLNAKDMRLIEEAEETELLE
ncbi:MAG: hypothetical protein FWE23_07060 [Chitinivibrionia bacterium]|nr:hypothetical protein [Chitinivibrionia bacterium]